MKTFKRPLKTMATLSATGILMLTLSMPANAAVCVDTSLLDLDLGTCQAEPTPTVESTPDPVEKTASTAAIAVPLPSPLPDVKVKLPVVTAKTTPATPAPAPVVVPLVVKPAPAPAPAAPAPIPGVSQPQTGSGETSPIVTALPPAPKAAADSGPAQSVPEKRQAETAVTGKPWSTTESNDSKEEKAPAKGTITQVNTPGQANLTPSGFNTDPLVPLEESLIKSEPARQSVLIAGGAVVVLLIGSFLFRRFGLPALG